MLQAMVVVFGFMALGYFAQRKEEQNRSLAKLCLYYLIPILIFQSFVHTGVSVQSLAIIVLHFFATTILVYFLLMYMVGRLFGWQQDTLKWNALAATLANVGYFGLAVIRYAVGEHAVPYAVAVSLAFNLYMALFGFSQVGDEREWSGRIRRVFQNPYLYAVLAGLSWQWMGWTMPGTVDAFLNLAASATLPLTLLLTGAEMRKNKYARTGLWEAAKVSVLKLVLPVLIAWPLAFLMTEDPVERSVMILMFGMPTSLNLLLLAKDQERDTSALAMVILLTTVLSPFSLMVVMNQLP
ncbi:AEC family transporter [Brevibacillus choshinensis]|uniref:AEC family transporter n=1 Tax=Brevibacillus choshinensis TaxID=54911 RepID=A0ABX7FRJ9_BRECH|nr:AEC family transporter [Brevibacillus choshinensis]QRG68430.1 AEC family transporter [Brevibacillus choshinensis]